MQTIYGAEMTLGEARAEMFARSGFAADGGYGERWVKIKMGFLPIWFPNTEGRRKAVPLHDLHHVLTEYPTTWRGESEIGAWEVATGLRRHYIGWLLDLYGFALGLVINPRGVYRAFVRGRHSENLYGLVWDEAILSSRVGEVRRRLRLDGAEARATPGDKISFALWAAAAVATYVATGALLLSPVFVLAAAIYFSGVV